MAAQHTMRKVLGDQYRLAFRNFARCNSELGDPVPVYSILEFPTSSARLKFEASLGASTVSKISSTFLRNFSLKLVEVSYNFS